MKKTIYNIIILLSITTVASAYEGVVVVLNAPIFIEANLKSDVSQYSRKGDKIFIHSKQNKANSIINAGGERFYLTIDNLGRKGYIPQKFVQINYLDNRELRYKQISHDPTDYRLAEPLQDDHPFFSRERYRSFIAVGIGTGAKSNYRYTENITNENRGNKYDLSIAMTYNPLFDRSNRFYFGSMITLNSLTNEFTLYNGRNSSEKWQKYGFGPYVSYDLFRYRKSVLSAAGGFQYNFVNKNTVIQEDPAGNMERKVYKAYSLSPHVDFILKFDDAIPRLSFISGISLQYELYGDLKTTAATEAFPSWWNSDDQIDISPHVEATLFIGIQFREREKNS